MQRDAMPDGIEETNYQRQIMEDEMSDDYTEEDRIMRECSHGSTFILWERMCTCCGKTIESEVIQPGTEATCLHVTVQP